MSKRALKLIQESDLIKALANFHNKNVDCVKLLKWSAVKGSSINDGYTTELFAVKGNSKISEKIQNFSFMVKIAPDVGHRVELIKKVGTGSQKKIHPFDSV